MALPGAGRCDFWGARRIVVATTDLWSTNALKSLEGHAIPIEQIGIDDLDAMTVEWSSYDIANPSGLRPKDPHTLRPHQIEALDAVRLGFQRSDRGKLIMACGTGKTFTALRIAEEHAGPGKPVLFLAPSIAMVAQSLKEWTAECDVPIRPFAVCSDNTAGKPLEGENATPHDLVVPPTTDPEALIAAGVNQLPDAEMTVVFSTYQSIEVVAAMQAATGLRFDLIVCDAAHRTAGVASVAGDDSAFALVHDDAAYLRRSFDAGARGYLVKDAADVELVLAVRHVAAGDEYVHPSLGAALLAAESATARPSGPGGELSEREVDVLRMVALGHTNADIADELYVSVGTVESHRAHVQQKLGVKARADLVRVAREHGLIDDDIGP